MLFNGEHAENPYNKKSDAAASTTTTMASTSAGDHHRSNAFKLHIDSNLIRTNSSALPDELKDLGVCAYDENDFEEG